MSTAHQECREEERDSQLWKCVVVCGALQFGRSAIRVSLKGEVQDSFSFCYWFVQIQHAWNLFVDSIECVRNKMFVCLFFPHFFWKISRGISTDGTWLPKLVSICIFISVHVCVVADSEVLLSWQTCSNMVPEGGEVIPDTSLCHRTLTSPPENSTLPVYISCMYAESFIDVSFYHILHLPPPPFFIPLWKASWGIFYESHILLVNMWTRNML